MSAPADALISGPVFWTIVGCVALGNYALRGIFFFALERIPLTDTLKTVLRYIPPSVLAALVAPAIVLHQGVLTFPLPFLDGKERLIAGCVAFLFALWKRSIVLTIIVGMVALYILQAVFG